VVIERMILLWVENFEKGCSRVTVEVALTDLVNLVARKDVRNCMML